MAFHQYHFISTIETLRKLAEDNADCYSRASQILRDFYVDDLVIGADSVEEVLSIKKEIMILLQKGKFLRKWTSNAFGLQDQNSSVEKREFIFLRILSILREKNVSHCKGLPSRYIYPSTICLLLRHLPNLDKESWP